MDIDTQFMLNSIPVREDSKAFLPTNVPFDNSYLKAASQMALPYQDFAAELGYGGDPTKIQGIGSDVRHTVGSAKGKFAVQDYLKDNLAIPTDNFLSNFLGNAAIYGSTFAQEIPDAIKNIPEGGINFYKQPLEDIRANLRATSLPYGTKDAELLEYAVNESPSKNMIQEAKGSPDFPLNMIRLNRFPPDMRFPVEGVDPDYKYGTVAADDIIPVTENQGIAKEDDLMNYDEFYEMPEEKKKGILQTLLSRGKEVGGNVFDKISNLGIGGVLKNLDNFKNLSPLDRQFILGQAGGNLPMKDAFGYNIRSARGNYAQLVKDRAKLADFRKSIGKPIRAIDKYYLEKEKERQKQFQQKLQESIQTESGADSYTSQAMAHESKVGRDSGERMGRI